MAQLQQLYNRDKNNVYGVYVPQIGKYLFTWISFHCGVCEAR